MKGRRFCSRERVALYLTAGGQCSLCGESLIPGWHADHVMPWSLGGPTDVINGQALCARCNLRKGSRMLREWPKSMDLRSWQKRGFKKFLASSNPNFLAVATPGSGKTRFALRIAHELFSTRRADRLIIVCHSEYLKSQWAEAAAECGIDITPEFENADGSFARDYLGAAVTYAQVNSQPDLIRRICSEVRTLAICDEVHHPGEGNPWGNSTRRALETAARRLLLSGTPFREDDNPIPFVIYDQDRKSVPSFPYNDCGFP